MGDKLPHLPLPPAVIAPAVIAPGFPLTTLVNPGALADRQHATAASPRPPSNHKHHKKRRKTGPQAGPSAAETPRSPTAPNGRGPVESPQPPQQIPAAPNEAEPTSEEIKQQAIKLLLDMGVADAAKAQRAIESAAENDSEVITDAAQWAEEAMVWLAMDNECAAEAQVMGMAMQVSLEEAEKKKAEEKSIHECTADEIKEKFKNSAMLAMEENHALLYLDTQHAARRVYIDYLELEKKCQQWYPTSKYYYQYQAEEFAALVQDDNEVLTAVAAAAGASQSQPQEAGGKKGKKRGRPKKGSQASSPAELAPSPPQPDGSEDSNLAKVLKERLMALQEEVFRLPEGDEQAFVPEIFKAMAPPDHTELVDLLDDD